MIPGNFIYVFAGEKISEIERPDQILTWPVIFLLVLVSFLPFIFRRTLNYLKKENYDEESIS